VDYNKEFVAQLQREYAVKINGVDREIKAALTAGQWLGDQEFRTLLARRGELKREVMDKVKRQINFYNELIHD